MWEEEYGCFAEIIRVFDAAENTRVPRIIIQQWRTLVLMESSTEPYFVSFAINRTRVVASWNGNYSNRVRMHVSAERTSLHGVINPFASTNILERALNCPLSPRARVYAANVTGANHPIVPLVVELVFENCRQNSFLNLKSWRRVRKERHFFLIHSTHTYGNTFHDALKFCGEMKKRKERKGIFSVRVLSSIYGTAILNLIPFFVLMKKRNEWFWGILYEMCRINLKNLFFFLEIEKYVGRNRKWYEIV